MSTHFLVVLAELVTLTGLLFLLTYASAPARAQSGASPAGLPPPPAFAIALRLLVGGQPRQAVEKLQEVQSSSTYSGTAYAPEATYLIAHIDRGPLRDGVRAMAAYDALATTYGLFSFPHKAAAAAERRALGRTLDAANAGRPLYRALDFFVRLTGRRPWSYAAALLLISLLVRLALLPLTAWQYQSLREAQALQPQMQKLRADHRDDPKRLHEEICGLQKQHGVNPALGMLMGLLQAPVFWAMYQAVSFYQYHFNSGTFLWIGGRLAAAHPQFLASTLAQPDLLLLALYAAGMYAAQRLAPAADPAQAKTQRAVAWLMPLLFCSWIWTNHTASAFVLYWLISSVLSTATQLYYLRQRPALPAAA